MPDIHRPPGQPAQRANSDKSLKNVQVPAHSRTAETKPVRWIRAHWCQARTTSDSLVQSFRRRRCAAQSRHLCVAAVAMPDGACVPFLADLSHVFLSCAAAVRPAVNCLAAGTAGLVGSHCPRGYPCATGCPGAVLLLGDESVWAPAGGEAAQGLWLHLRLLFCRRCLGPPKFAIAGLRGAA
jgi:hypothetical protein